MVIRPLRFTWKTRLSGDIYTSLERGDSQTFKTTEIHQKINTNNNKCNLLFIFIPKKSNRASILN